MYLSGLAGPITIGNQVYSGPGDDPALNVALYSGEAARPTGGNYAKRRFAGGWLLDNCPLNVVLGQGWLPTQQNILAAAGLVPYCPEVGPVGAKVPPPTVLSPTVTTILAPGFEAPGIPDSGGGVRVPTGVVAPTASVPVPGATTTIVGPGFIDEGPVITEEGNDFWKAVALGVTVALISTWATKRKN